MNRLYADVDYMGQTYLDAERIDGIWYFERPFGEVHSFMFQSRVRVLNEPQADPRHWTRASK